MRTYRCRCSNPLYFDNSVCLVCRRDVGFCPACRRLVTLLPTATGQFQCGEPDCGAALVKCFNYSEYEVCNRCLVAEGGGRGQLCGCCRFNHTIPDLEVSGNLQKWYRLESAKRRLFYDLDQLGLPYGTTADGIKPCLAFDFKTDVVAKTGRWRGMDKSQQVYTGHNAGLITINIREADTVEREKRGSI